METVIDRSRAMSDRLAAEYAAALAAKGAAFLDIAYPEWFTRVDPGRLDISDPVYCIWGQLVGDYAVVTGWVFAPDAGAGLDFLIDHGFAAGFASPSRLTAAWRNEIAKRRAA